MATVGSSEFSQERNLSVRARLRKVLPVLAASYAFVALKSFVPGVPTGSALLIVLSASTIVLFSLGSWMLLRNASVASGRSKKVSWAIGLLVLADGLLRLSAVSDPSGAAILVALIIGGAYALTWEDFASMAILSGAGWVAVCAWEVVRVDPFWWSGTLFAAAVLSGLGARLRDRRERGAYQKRVEAQHQAADTEPLAGSLDDAASHKHLALAVQGTQDGLWYWDLKSNTFQFSSAWEALLGFEKGELKMDPKEWLSRVHPGYQSELRARISAHLHGETEQFRHEHRVRRKGGEYVWVSARATATRDSKGEAIGLAGSHTDITSLITVERQLLDDAFHDKLTGLPNRHFFMGRLDTAIEQKRQQGAKAQLFAVMFLDLDRFKNINDTLGHQIGDQLLISVGGRLQGCVGSSGMVARLGGDEFVVLLDRVRDPDEALSVGARISEALRAPFEIGGSEVLSGASIGIALSRESFEGADELVHLADLAMYHSKTQRKGRPELFHDRMNAQATKASNLQKELARALKQDEFLLDYQPCFSIQSGKILGVEALIRWRRSENEVLSPSDFIPLAEESGLIHEIGEWVLREACAQSSAWQRAGVPPVRMAVNLSAKQLQQADFPQRVLSILDETRLASRWLELELTETGLMDGFAKAPDTLKRLDTMGIRTSIDDFGTGYSSLNYLRRFNFQTLKMDRCFVSDISTDQRAAAIVRSLISLAHSLDISVIAEGVETNAQLRLLAAERCDQVQGFLTSRPIAPEQMLNLLRSVDAQQRDPKAVSAIARELFQGCAETAPIIQLGTVLAESSIIRIT
jgi:diguanylate cyclase (GGDEF)-like protein/PAS domain S-box-containing protein